MKLVLIEDQPVIRTLVAEILRAEGHDVADFATAKGGLAFLAAQPAGWSDAVLLDWLLPDLPGQEALGLVMADPAHRCLVISGYPVDLSQLPHPWRPRIGFLPKPFTPKMLAEALAEVIGRAVADEGALAPPTAAPARAV